MKKLSSLVLILGVFWYEGYTKHLHNNTGETFITADEIQSSGIQDSVIVDELIAEIRKFRFSEPERAISFADSALSIAREQGLKVREAEILNQLGIIASVRGDSPTALEYFLSVLRVREEIGDTPGIARIQNNLGILYKNLNDFERSLEFHSKSLETKRLLDDSLGIARSLNNIGEIYQQQRNPEEAKKYFEESLDLMLELDFKEGLAATYNNLGEAYKLLNDIDNAIQFHSKSLEIEKELGNISGIGFSYLNIASLFMLVNQPNVAITNFEEAISYFSRINDLNGLQKAYNEIAIAYSSVENFQESLYYFQLHTALKDSLASVENNRRIAELQTEYEAEKQKQEIDFLTERSTLQEIQLRQETIARNLLLIIVLLLISLAFMLYRSNKSNKRINTLLVEKSKSIEEAVDLKAQFLSVMSHEIRTPMNAVVGMANLLASENPREDQKAYLETLNFSASNLLSIVNDVLDYSKAEAGKIKLEEIDFRLLHLMSNVHNSFYNQSIKEDVYLKFEYDEKIPEVLIGDPTRLTQILNNLISNALKFTEEGSVIVNVSLEDQKDDSATINFRVTDTGIGIPDHKLESIFESFVQASTEVHRKYGGSGLGLPITKKLLELHNSEIKVVSVLGKGTTFSFSINLL
ncbi:MAG: tetratricopeptide repeat protein, partial [Balneolales bacterium]|nr:tetratricopeptide repeat protein [Balneolales bacterium]